MAQSAKKNYIGRFAPSPTGPLHIGSLLAALGSFLQAKKQGGNWLVRIEDLDPPREVPGASDDILQTLEKFHLYWDGDILYQSQRHEVYREVLEQLKTLDLIYPCTCSRKTIQQDAHYGPLGMIYPGNCRANTSAIHGRHSLRLRVPNINICFKDHIQGQIALNLEQQIGDTNLFRADGFFAYHLAVVVDDALQEVSEVVRGSDLLYSTPLHIYLQNCLDYITPSYLHLPVLENLNGDKLSKQTGAQAISQAHPPALLLRLLAILGQKPPPELSDGSLDEILGWAITHWNINNLPLNNIKLDETLD